MHPVDPSPHPGLTIRPATPTDATVITEFNCRLALETEHKRLDPDTALRGARLGLEHQEMCRYFLAENHGRPVGQAMITYEWSDWRAGMFWWFQSVYVHPDFRQLGVFRRLFHHIQDLARNTPGTCGLRLYVEAHNHRAIETYARLGLRPSGHTVYELDWSR
jgi:GNAT superfamily N-acetyltransferase